MRDEVGEEIDMGHRSYTKEFQTYPEGSGRVGSVPVEEVTIELLHCNEHSDSNVGDRLKEARLEAEDFKRLLQRFMLELMVV